MTTYVGTGANDTLNGSANSDSMSGLDGNDSLSGNIGNDTLFGGDGDDTLVGGAGADLLYGGTDDDVIYADFGDSVDGGTQGPVGDVLYITFKDAPAGVNADLRPLAQGSTLTVGSASTSASACRRSPSRVWCVIQAISASSPVPRFWTTDSIETWCSPKSVAIDARTFGRSAVRIRM